jgi:hypothetical protein
VPRTRQDAIRCGTVAGAYAARKNCRALFSRGNSRDLVVLAQDPFKADPSELLKIQLPPQPALVARQNKKSSQPACPRARNNPCRTGCQRSKAVPSRAVLDVLRGEHAASPCSLETV